MSYRCDKFEFTNLNQCQQCQEHQQRPAKDASEPTRHLLFHLWPKNDAEETWKWNLDQLKKRWSLFNGKRVIAVAESEDSASMEYVQDYMDGYECYWMAIKNDPMLREVKSFFPLWNMLRDCDGENHFTFYAQGKGVTRYTEAIRTWTEIMYETCLDYWPLVRSILSKYPLAGSFKKTNYAGFYNSKSAWHYSGSFTWFRNKDLFTLNDWATIDRQWSGIESWASIHFNQEQAGAIFYERDGPFKLYDEDVWEGISKEYGEWKLQHDHQYVAPNQ